MTQFEDLRPLELRRLAADKPRERSIGADDCVLAGEHRLTDWRRFECRAQQCLGALQRPAVLLELSEHGHLGAKEPGSNGLST